MNCFCKKKIIKIASPIQSVINTLNKAKELYASQGIDLQVIKTNFTEESGELLINGTVDGLIYANVHVLKNFNKCLKSQNKETLAYVQPFYHSKYGLYCNKKNSKKLWNLDEVKKHKNLKVLLAVAFSYIEPCDTSRSLLLLKNLNLIQIQDSIIKTKKLSLNFSDIKNPYRLEFLKTSQIPHQFEQNPDQFDLMANWPAFMKYNDDFIRIGSNIDNDKEPTDELVESYAIALACRKNNENSEEIQITKQILKNPAIKEFHVNQNNNNNEEKDYVMIENPDALKQRIIKNWLM
ncbi:MetQ/NlpA family ABC transporter substrate-binding protein [Candidatus Phytoplasma solani]|uniref:ABC-type amino acid transport system, substrate-binding protein n=1 Tax=Candidatus Phytoplasma solani TaxID=69896 RepID=A0A421NXH8_9MOLU|nr:MetQ/NlpA family ABC transporter substrate-binding protein [Candidatus Phytoplasma solani]RMI88630.1 ABC-type amino acid transport system, substrate-binding protein [Candidatus Phytoplasma solani]